MVKKSTGDRVTKQKWLGGFIRMTKSGRPTYIIEKHIHGAYFKVSTRRNTERGAIEEFERFEVDPAAYVAGLVDALPMTPELVMEYRAWQIGEKGNLTETANWNASMLRDWLKALSGKDLRRVSATKDIKPALAAWKTSRAGRIVALKGFYSWLRKEKGLVQHHQDPMPDVRIPKGGSSRETAPRDHPYKLVMRVYRCLREDVRDILQLLVGTGWHLSEVIRFASTGEIRKDPTGKHRAVLVTWHKRREKAVSGLMKVAHVEAAKRIRAKGYTLGRSRLAFLMRRANYDAGIPKGQEVFFGDMRHTVSTWAHEMGEDIENTAKAFNHTDAKMLRQHYVRHAVPRATIKVKVLR